MKQMRWLSVLLLVAGCRLAMHDQPKHEPLEKTSVFEDERVARPLVEGTVPRGHLNADTVLHTGRANGALVDYYPFEIDREWLTRGQQRYDIYCSVCHGKTGDGLGMVVRRGFKQPSSFHEERLLNMPAGYFVDVINQGFGAMYSYKDRVKPEDRWAIAAYIQTLQLSQNATIEDVPLAMRKDLKTE